MPSARDQDWRFAGGKKRDFSPFSPATTVDAKTAKELLERTDGIDGAIQLVFANGQCISAPTLPEAAVQAGLICSPIADAKELPASIEAALAHAPRCLGGEKFANLHQAHLGTGGGLVLSLPKGLELEAPIEVVHWISGEGASIFPRTVIHAGEGSSATVVERILSDGETEAGFSCSALQIDAPANARIGHVLVETLGRPSKAIHFANHEAGRDSDVKACILALGGDWFRSESVARMTAEGANCDMLSVALSSREQEFDQRTLQHHLAPRATSDLLFKHALYDKSRTIFSGLIQVDEGAHYTDAFQTCRNLLLSDEAEANAMPGLEINADQVKCSHGSTTARISEEEIFYLRARGVRPEAARKLVLLGFTREVIDRIGNDAVIEKLAEAIEGKFVRVGEGE